MIRAIVIILGAVILGLVVDVIRDCAKKMWRNKQVKKGVDDARCGIFSDTPPDVDADLSE